MTTLLIVEDDTDIQDYYQILFSGLGARLLCAHTGKQGLAFVDAGEDIDLILLDIVLPEMGGEEFFHELRIVRKAATGVIVCSVDEKLIEPLRRIGPIQGTFLKGTPGSTLIAMIKQQLGLEQDAEKGQSTLTFPPRCPGNHSRPPS